MADDRTDRPFDRPKRKKNQTERKYEEAKKKLAHTTHTWTADTKR